MDEFQLVETYREGWAVLWGQMQWWASVSFGLLALASFGRKHLSFGVAIGLTTLYSLFSIFCYINFQVIVVSVSGAIAELETLEDITYAGQNILDAQNVSSINGLFFYACFLATFCGSLAYLWHSYHKNKSEGG
jgi:hypothetical protein